MTDVLTPEQRKYNMSKIRSKDSKPEMLVRRMIHSMGYRYRLHVKSLPGSPDLVFKAKKKIIFVHGCFWHLHRDCKFVKLPKTNRSFWYEKLIKNKKRDQKVVNKLGKMGWDVLIVWECEVKADIVQLRVTISHFLNDNYK